MHYEKENNKETLGLSNKDKLQIFDVLTRKRYFMAKSQRKSIEEMENKTSPLASLSQGDG